MVRQVVAFFHFVARAQYFGGCFDHSCLRTVLNLVKVSFLRLLPDSDSGYNFVPGLIIILVVAIILGLPVIISGYVSVITWKIAWLERSL